MITLPQLKMLAKQNNIHYTRKNKDEIVKLLLDKNIITLSDLINPKIVVEPVKRNVDKYRYEHLKGIRNNPKQVEIFDKQKGETNTFPSMYKAGRAVGVDPRNIKDGATWKNRYIITVK